MQRKWLVALLVGVLVLLAAAGGLLAWLLLRLGDQLSNSYDTIHLEGDGIGEAGGRAAFVRFREGAHMLRWFVPAEAAPAQGRPIVLWLDGVVGPPPSLLANFGTVGPYDYNLNRRNDSWTSDYNLLFVDAPVGSGFSFVEEEAQAAGDAQDNSEDLLRTLHSFYTEHEGYSETPLYILGQGYGAQMATHFALLLQEYIDRGEIECNLQGVILGNPIVSPALVGTALGFYLEELGYIDDRGRAALEAQALATHALVEGGRYGEAFGLWAGLEAAVAAAGAVAVNLHRIVDKLTSDSAFDSRSSDCAHAQCVRYLSLLPPALDVSALMDGTVAPALGVYSGVAYDSQKQMAAAGLLEEFMKPAQDTIEEILQNTELNVWIYNGNLDAISNTPGQLLWIEALEWDGAEAWAASARLPLAVGGTLEGYVRSSDRLHLYWMNVAGHVVPSDSPVAMREVLRRIAGF